MSGNANIIVVEGRLTRDPSYIKTKNGKSLCKFSIANNRYYYVNGSLQKEVYFFDLIAWGYTAEKVAVNLLTILYEQDETSLTEEEYKNALKLVQD